MRDAQLIEIASRQFNRVARWQLLEAGFTPSAIDRRLASGRLAAVHQAVYAVAPVLEHDDWGRWSGATLTEPDSQLSHGCATVAWGLWGTAPRFTTITRPGSGGPRRHGNLLVFRSSTLDSDRAHLRGIPITSPPRTLLDVASFASERALARALREAVRLKHTSLGELGDALGRYRGRRGVARLAGSIARYSGLPLVRARSGAEIRALEVFRGAGVELPRLNVRIAGEEADLSWAAQRLIIEIDGGPFHLDKGEDERKEAIWRSAGWRVRRLPSDDVYERPGLLIELARR